MVSLWDMLSLCCGASAVAGALAAATICGGGTTKMSLGMILGITLGVSSILTQRSMSQRVGPEVSNSNLLLYLGAIAWVPVSVVVALSITMLIIQVVTHEC